MKSTNINILKKKLLEALEKTLGVVTTACKLAECDRTTFYNYYNKDKDFAQKVDDIENIAIDFAESQLHKQIKDGNTTATIFYLKTKAKKRGYVERVENHITNDQPIINIEIKDEKIKTELAKLKK